MRPKPVAPRVAANRDIESIIDHYLAEGAPDAAEGFVAELQRTLRLIGAQPGLGSPHYAQELRIPGLRHQPIRRYPYLVFYVERSRFVDVWRVLHGQRDIPAWMKSES